MKIPSTDIDDLDLFQDFFDRLQEEKLSFKDFMIKSMKDFAYETPVKETVNKSYKPHKADYLITELAIRYIESSLSSIHKSNVPQTSLYSVISNICIDLLDYINTPKAKYIINNFDQDTAIEYIKSKLYN